MSIEYSRNLFSANDTVLAEGQHFVTKMILVDESVVAADGDGKKILKLGTILAADGTIVNDGTAVGIVLQNVDFTNSNGKEMVAVVVHGFVTESKMPVAPAATAKTALNMIKFW